MAHVAGRRSAALAEGGGGDECATCPPASIPSVLWLRWMTFGAGVARGGQRALNAVAPCSVNGSAVPYANGNSLPGKNMKP